jgi:putative ABC transport system substrate-binding protein
MKRRAFIGALAGGLLASPLPVWAQPSGRVHRLGMLSLAGVPAPSERAGSSLMVPAALREMGYIEGRTLVVERRYAEGKIDRLPGLARELVQLQVDVIVTIGTHSASAAKQATTTIPIVMYGNFDPVAVGLVASLARPGGNITGVLIAPDGTLAGKKLELLKAAVPRATRIALLAPEELGPQVEEVRKAAAALGVTLSAVEVKSGDYDRAFATVAAERPAALFVAAHSLFFRDRRRIIELAAKHRLPAMYEWPEQVEDGGLMSYGSSLAGTLQRVAAYVDRIFKGARPGDLPIEQPTNFQLVINLRTAKALGLTLSPSLLARADRVIQ